jgi:ligand-binding SRPBCC domain-containing protein
MHGFPFRWESRITEFRENAMFADEQLVGPYRYWYHRHLFRTVPDGVAIEDEVEYQLPFGLLGRVAHAAFVRRQLEQIFDYRAHAIAARLPLQPAREGKKAFT